MIIYIENHKYDVTEFINEHPGGADVFKDGADLTKEFNEVGHSKEAIKTLKQYLVEDKTKEATKKKNKQHTKEKLNLDEVSVKEFFLHKFSQTKFSRLFTKEDKANIHKILGVTTLLMYAWYYASVFKNGSKYGIPQGRNITDVALSMLPAVFLSVSSLQFNLSNNFPTNGTGALNNEYRNVNVLFSIRSILLAFIGVLCRNSPNVHTILVWGILMLNMWFREKITAACNYVGKKKSESNAIRSGVKYWNGCPNWFSNNIRIFYSTAQLTFNAWVMLSTSIYPSLSALFVMQLAAFAGTLTKKNVIGLFGWHCIYIFSYLLVFLGLILHENPEPLICGKKGLVILGILAYVLRVEARITRYSLWTLYAVAILCCRKYSCKTTCIIVTVTLMTLYATGYLQDPSQKKTDFRDIIQANIETVPGIHIINISLKNKLCMKPGQYMNMYIDEKSKPYTPIKWNSRSTTFLIKSFKGGISQKICDLWQANTDAFLSGPFGNKYYDPEKDALMIQDVEVTRKKIIMFCCGTGITPFYSILTNLSKHTKYKCKLYASFKSRADRFLVQDIPKSSAKKRCFYSQEGTRLTKETVEKILSKNKKAVVLVCGTKSYNEMIKSCCGDERICYCW